VRMHQKILSSHGDDSELKNFFIATRSAQVAIGDSITAFG